MPEQKPGESRQDYVTPQELVTAVEHHWLRERFEIDLAASDVNSRAPSYFSEEDDALVQDWDKIRGWAWLNPPFGKLPAFAAKCAASRRARVVMLSPASVGTEWFAEHVLGRAYVLAIRPRIKFVGETDPYPKDLMLSIFGWPPGFSSWRWDGKP